MWSVCPAGTLLWTVIWLINCVSLPAAEEVELFPSAKQSRTRWTSQPKEDWVEINLRLGVETVTSVYQACRDISRRRTLLSHWIQCQDAHHILLDVEFAQEEEEVSGLQSPLHVHIFESDTPLTRFLNDQDVLELQTSKPFPSTTRPNQISTYLNRSAGLSLGSVTQRGFHLGFSYSGTCVFITSVRLYYMKCPEVAGDLARFEGAAAGSGSRTGFCMDGAVELSQPVRECQVDGTWGPLHGGCICRPGHQNVDGTCQACRRGYYKATNESGGCQPCPANSNTDKEGSESCDCLQGYNRLPTDPHDRGCTKPPSAPVNLTVQWPDASVLLLLWDPPQDRGGREEVMYSVRCLGRAEEGGSAWQACGEDVVFLPASAGLTGTAVNITGLNPQDDYRLSVQAWNHVSVHQRGGTSSSAATITIQRHPEPQPRLEQSFSMWLVVVVVFGALSSLVLLVFIPTAVYALCRNHNKLSAEQDLELLPMTSGVPYRRAEEPDVPYRRAEESDPEPQQLNTEEGVVQLLEGLSVRLLAGLREVLVERHQLTLGKELGKGEFGSVYEGIFTPEEGLDVKVAVKTMKVGIHSQEDLHEFLREAEIMKTFDHSNVVRLLGVSLEREQDCRLPVPLVVLPFMKHGDLRRFLIATRYGDIPMFVPHQSLLRFMTDIAAGMEYLSSHGFLHRDLAARNCMLGDDLRVCVADFGLSKKIYSSSYYRQNVAIRVPIKWMAMESLSESMYTTKSDVWSFGVTMWEIVSRGRTPYPGVHNHELLDLLTSGHRLKQPDDCGSKLYEAMRSCWDEDPGRRTGFGALVQTLQGLLRELPVLEASQEACYINQGLEVAAAAAAYQDATAASERHHPQTDTGGAVGNIYLAAPVGAAPRDKRDAAEEMDEEEGGYLLCTLNGSPVHRDEKY